VVVTNKKLPTGGAFAMINYGFCSPLRLATGPHLRLREYVVFQARLSRVDLGW